MDYKNISYELHRWYSINKRDLPWRLTRDPYLIWVSEIIMQQTRIEQGTPYYLRFVERFPTVDSLANAPMQDVLILWQGLGYYSRARNMHHAALMVMDNFNGIFPSTYSELLTLKGIGTYTAAAISSMASSEKKAVVDGNVIRWISRMWNISTPVEIRSTMKEIETHAGNLIEFLDSGTINQAMMEFGALFCTPANMKCDDCVFNKVCQAFLEKRQDSLPVKRPKKAVAERYFNYFFVYNEGSFVIKRRASGDIWQGLFELPLIEQKKLDGTSMDDFFGFNISAEHWFSMPKHLLSHQRIQSTVFGVNCKFSELNQFAKTIGGEVIDFDVLEKYPVSKLMQQIFLLISDKMKKEL